MALQRRRAARRARAAGAGRRRRARRARRVSDGRRPRARARVPRAQRVFRQARGGPCPMPGALHALQDNVGAPSACLGVLQRRPQAVRSLVSGELQGGHAARTPWRLPRTALMCASEPNPRGSGWPTMASAERSCRAAQHRGGPAAQRVRAQPDGGRGRQQRARRQRRVRPALTVGAGCRARLHTHGAWAAA